jgi:hypothetical protein
MQEQDKLSSEMKRGVVKLLSDQYRSGSKGEAKSEKVSASVAEAFYGHAPGYVVQHQGRGTSYYGGGSG